MERQPSPNSAGPGKRDVFRTRPAYISRFPRVRVPTGFFDETIIMPVWPGGLPLLGDLLPIARIVRGVACAEHVEAK